MYSKTSHSQVNSSIKFAAVKEYIPNQCGHLSILFDLCS